MTKTQRINDLNTLSLWRFCQTSDLSWKLSYRLYIPWALPPWRHTHRHRLLSVVLCAATLELQSYLFLVLYGPIRCTSSLFLPCSCAGDVFCGGWREEGSGLSASTGRANEPLSLGSLACFHCTYRLKSFTNNNKTALRWIGYLVAQFRYSVFGFIRRHNKYSEIIWNRNSKGVLKTKQIE